MSLDLSKLTVSTGAKMPTAQRGRTATPVPQSFLDAVKRTYDLPEGQGASMKVPNGEKNDNGKDSNVITVTGQLRKAATQLGYGLSIKVCDPTKATTEILFRAKDKTERTRRTKDELRADKLIAAWVASEATEYDGSDDDTVALAAWETYCELPADEDPSNEDDSLTGA